MGFWCSWVQHIFYEPWTILVSTLSTNKFISKYQKVYFQFWKPKSKLNRRISCHFSLTLFVFYALIIKNIFNIAFANNKDIYNWNSVLVWCLIAWKQEKEKKKKKMNCSDKDSIADLNRWFDFTKWEKFHFFCFLHIKYNFVQHICYDDLIICSLFAFICYYTLYTSLDLELKLNPHTQHTMTMEIVMIVANCGGEFCENLKKPQNLQT